MAAIYSMLDFTVKYKMLQATNSPRLAIALCAICLAMAFRIKSLDGKVLITQEVAAELGCSASRVRQLVSEGKLDAARTKDKGNRIFYLPDVERLKKQRGKK